MPNKPPQFLLLILRRPCSSSPSLCRQCLLPQTRLRNYGFSNQHRVTLHAQPSSSPSSTCITHTPPTSLSSHPYRTRQYYSTSTPTPTPTPLTPQQYHTLSTTTIDTLLSSLEDLAESSPSPSSNNQTITDVEFSAGVLTVQVDGKGTWVINKQPPNRQIWLSSPLSGPRRFDWVAERDGDGEGKGKWLCLREGEVMVELGELLRRELGDGLAELAESD